MFSCLKRPHDGIPPPPPPQGDGRATQGNSLRRSSLNCGTRIRVTKLTFFNICRHHPTFKFKPHAIDDERYVWGIDGVPLSTRPSTILQQSSTSRVVAGCEPFCLQQSSTSRVVADREPFCLQQSSTSRVVTDREPFCLQQSSTSRVVPDSEPFCLQQSSTSRVVADCQPFSNKVVLVV